MKKVLFVYQYAFSKTGGIETYNRNFIRSLEKFNNEKLFECEIFSVYDNPNEIKSVLPFKSAKGSKIMAVLNSLKYIGKFDIIIFAHVNLAPIALIIKTLYRKTNIFFCTHGIDVWRQLPKYTDFILDKSTILTVSHFTKNILIKYNPKLKDIHVIPNTIDITKKIKKVSESPYNNYEKNILSVTRLDSTEVEKGIDTVIEAIPFILKEIPNFKYSVIGRGSDIGRLKNLAIKLNLEKSVDFLGFVEDLESYYKHCDLFVLPSKKEGFGIVYLEAMKYKKPVIASNFGGVTDVVVDGETGYLCDYGDFGNIAKKIVLLLKNHELSIEMGDKAFKRVQEKFSPSVFENLLLNLLNK